ncbi:MAG: N-acetylmuramoyl-L-alanine amidase [Pseudobutyrivibrio sp.]|nr:N-acetylmuramoyl-L-alanine amidase [Pseudobutyrivibrio sp.]
MIYVAKNFVTERIQQSKDPLTIARETELPDWIDVQLIEEGNPSRSGVKLDGINDIVVHYVGNPGTSAQQNRDFYNGWGSDVCSHFLVGMDGEIIMCIPLDEKSAASNHRNHDTISVEVCHPDATGKFTEASYESTLKLVRWLMDEFHLDKDHVIRHYDVTGKECPRYFVDHPEAWEKFKNDL